MKVIYGLYTLDESVDGERKYFYVGKTNNTARRMKEHHRAKAKGSEDKYDYIREIEAKEINWEVEELARIPDQDYWRDHERWFVIKLIREGHDLMNMRHGDRKQLKEIAEQVESPLIRSAADVQRDREERETIKRRKSRSLRRRVRTKALKTALKTTGIPSLEQDTFLPAILPIIYKRLLAYGTRSIEKGVELTTIIRFANKKYNREMTELSKQAEAYFTD